MDVCASVPDFLGSALKYYFLLYLLFLGACVPLIEGARLPHVTEREAFRLQTRLLLNLEEALPSFSRTGQNLIRARRWGLAVLALLTILYLAVNESCLPG